MPQRILVADDDRRVRDAIKGLLQAEDVDVFTARNGQEALDLFAEILPDLVLSDVDMPVMNGFELCRSLKSVPEWRLTPVVLVTALTAVDDRVTGIEAGADDFISKPFEGVALLARVRSLLKLKRYTDELERAEMVIFALSTAIEGKDPYTEGHCERLSTWGVALGRRLALAESEIDALRKAGTVHDVGKIAVPDSVLKKKGRLTQDEFALIKEHPVVGERICKPLKSFRLVLPIIRHHHEKLDGSGYPDGLKGSDIPITVRILTIVDVYDALSTKRPYKEAFSPEEALILMGDEVKKGWWDPDAFGEWSAYVQECLIPAAGN